MIILRQKEFGGNKANKEAKRKWMLEQAKEAGFKTEPTYYGSGDVVTDEKGKEVVRHYYGDGSFFKSNPNQEEYDKKGWKVRKATAEELAKENRRLQKETTDKALKGFRKKNYENRSGFSLARDYVEDRGNVDKLAAKQELKSGKYDVTRDTKTGEVRSMGLYEMPVSKEKDLDPINNEIYDKYNKENGTHYVDKEGFESQRQEELRKYKENKRRKIEQESQLHSQQSQNSQIHPQQEMSKSKAANILKKVGNLYTGKSKYGKKGQAIAIGGTLGTAALVGGGIALHRHNKKKKEEQEKKNNKKKNK